MGIFKKREAPQSVPQTVNTINQVTIKDNTIVAAIDFNVRNEVAESVSSYLGAYSLSSGRLSKITNNTSFLHRLVKHVLKYEQTFIYKSETYGWVMTDTVVLNQTRVTMTIQLPNPYNSSIHLNVPLQDVGVIDTTMMNVDTEAANKMLEAAYEAIIKKLNNTGAIKAFISSNVDVGLNKMAEDANDKIKTMLKTASELAGYTFLNKGDEVTQMMPDYTTSNTTDFAAMRAFAASQLSVSEKILDGSATDGEKVAVMFRFLDPILQQFKEYEPSLEYSIRDEMFVAFMTTGGLLNSNKIEYWGKEKTINDRASQV